MGYLGKTLFISAAMVIKRPTPNGEGITLFITAQKYTLQNGIQS